MNRWEAFTLEELIALYSAVNSRIRELERASDLPPEYAQELAMLEGLHTQIDTEGDRRMDGKVFGSEENE